MTIKRLPLAAALLAAAVGASACMPNTNGAIYTPSAALQAQTVNYGTITGVRTIEMRNVPGESDRALGAIAGGALGAAAGDELGDGNAMAIGGAAILGALAGDAASRTLNRHTAQEWTVALERGGSIAVVQTDPNLYVGQRVRVIFNGNQTRLAP